MLFDVYTTTGKSNGCYSTIDVYCMPGEDMRKALYGFAVDCERGTFRVLETKRGVERTVDDTFMCCCACSKAVYDSLF